MPKPFALFDCNCMLGRAPVRQPGAFFAVDGLLEEMDRLGIEQALVYSSIAQHYDPATGNRLLLEELAAAGRPERLHACWVLLPHATHEMGVDSAEVLVERMLAAGVRAARLFPTQHRFSLSDWSAGPLLRALERHRVPVFIDFGNVHWSDRNTDWDALYHLLKAHARLPVVLVHEGIGSDRYLYPLMEAFPDLLLETSYYQPHRGIEAICRRFGHERLLFGTGMPVWAPGPAISMLAYADISDDARRAIGRENLRRLLGAVS